MACLFEATVWMADLESTRRTAFLKATGLRSSCCSAMAISVISPSKLVLLIPTDMQWENSSEWIPAPAFPSIFDNDPPVQILRYSSGGYLLIIINYIPVLIYSFLYIVIYISN